MFCLVHLIPHIDRYLDILGRFCVTALYILFVNLLISHILAMNRLLLSMMNCLAASYLGLLEAVFILALPANNRDQA